MKVLKKVFVALFAVVFTTVGAFGNPNCKNANYRRAYPEKCKSSNNTTLLTVAGGAVLVGTGVALALQSSGGGHGSSAANQTNYQRTPLSANIVANYSLSDYVQNKKANGIYLDSLTNGNDIDETVLNQIKSDYDYQKNQQQFDAIDFAYATARGYSGKNIDIQIMDNFNTEHGNHVYAIATYIAPDANITTNNMGASENSFASFDYMANTISTTSPAHIYNASWQIPATANINAASAIYDNNGSPKTYAAAQSYMYNATSENFITQIRNTAIDNDAIFVWAAGNDMQNESGVLSALPLAFPDLSGHFVNVVALDNYGSIAWYSNQCGITQNYCITAPGSNWDVSQERTVSGTSFATPAVSGAIAVIKQAFPYMSATQITQLLFVTSTDLGETGVDSVYGWGLLNLERATKPVGTPRIVLSNDSIRPLSVSSIGGSAAPAIQKANIKIAFVDDFSRAFTTNLSEHIKVIPYGRGFDKLRENENDSFNLFDGFEFGFSQNHLLESSGLISVQSGQLTNFIGYKHEFKIGNVNFYQNARFGIAHLKAEENSIVSSFSNIYTSSAKIGTSWQDLSFEITVPETIISGDMSATLPIAKTNDGQIIYNNAHIDLSNTRPSIEYTFGYKYLSATFVDNPDYENEFFIMAKRKFTF
ncbi:MAG: S8 family serine peptidase [Alphaproteobacteria bacterium]|nr:S8 family serine peptidase [Alphaproteobacteria bacterium]